MFNSFRMNTLYLSFTIFTAMLSGCFIHTLFGSDVKNQFTVYALEEQKDNDNIYRTIFVHQSLSTLTMGNYLTDPLPLDGYASSNNIFTIAKSEENVSPDSQTIQLNPFVHFKKHQKTIKAVGFNIIHQNSSPDTSLLSLTNLGENLKMIFYLQNHKTVSLHVNLFGAHSVSNTNQNTNSNGNNPQRELALALFPIDHFQEILKNKIVSIEFSGSSHHFLITTDHANAISLNNILHFYRTYIS